MRILRNGKLLGIITAILVILLLQRPASAHLNPTVGRFMQEDPLGYVNGTNSYQPYTNNPVSWDDTFGLEVIAPPYPPNEGVQAGPDAVETVRMLEYGNTAANAARIAKTVAALTIITGVTVAGEYTLGQSLAELSKQLRITGYVASFNNYKTAGEIYLKYKRDKKIECPCKNALDLKTKGLSLAGKLDTVAYAMYTNIWIKDNGGSVTPVSTTKTMGPSGKPLADEAEAARRAERKRGGPALYPWVQPDGPFKAAGHVPDTIITGIADPGPVTKYSSPFVKPFWMPMDNLANSNIGSIEGNYVGKRVDCVTVDGLDPDPTSLVFPMFKAP